MTSTSIEAYLSELAKTNFLAAETVPHSFAYMVSYYRKGAPGKRDKFRIASTIVIVLSAMLPAVASFGAHLPHYLDKDAILSAMSVAVAALTGVLAHFRWEVGWRSQNEALFALEGLRTVWEAEVAKARAQLERPDALKSLMDAFDSFQRRAYEIVHAEMGEFFKVQQAPNGKPASDQSS
jgi:hypothetical protein